jgi:hypothetical protein
MEFTETAGGPSFHRLITPTGRKPVGVFLFGRMVRGRIVYAQLVPTGSRFAFWFCALTGWFCLTTTSPAEDFPLTRNVPIPEFQNRQEDVKPYDFDAPPQGMFRMIEVAEGFEEELGFRRQNEIIPVNPTSEFPSGAKPVFIVFQLYQHFQSFEIFGVCYPEEVLELDPKTVVARDTMYIATEDESGYLKLFPPTGGWKPGKYKVEIHVGEQINNISLIGTMRFTVVSSKATSGTGG